MFFSMLLGCPSGTPKDSTDDTATTAGLSVVAEGLDAGLISVQGTDDGDVWIVGADPGTGPAFLHWDGSAWEVIDTGQRGDMWWVQPTAAGAVLVGADGQILEYDGTTTTQVLAGAPVTFFGVWGPSDDDLWAVGGDTQQGEAPAVYRNHTGAWERFSDPVLDEIEAPELYFKVHGTSANDVWIVGSAGILLHWDGSAFTRHECGSAVLFTVHAGGDFPVAVGGSGTALVCNYTGGDWQNVSPPFVPMMNGVSGRGDTLVATGQQGAVLRWDGAAWVDDADRVTTEVLHAVWIGPGEEIWAVGGSINSFPITEGVILHEGSSAIPSPF